MRWPWTRRLEEAREQAVQATEATAQAAVYAEEVKLELQEAKRAAGVLRRELEQNGWTELLRQAWGGA